MIQEKHRGRGDNFPPISAHHPAAHLHRQYHALVRFENNIPTGQDVLDSFDTPTFIRNILVERETLTDETIKRQKEQLAGALFERFAFRYTQLLFPDLYSPGKTSHFCNILIRQLGDTESQVIRYPFGTFSINNDIGSPDGIVVVDNGMPRVPLWFEYTAQRMSMEKKIRESHRRFQDYKRLYPGLFSHTKLIMMLASPAAVDTTRLPEDVHCAEVPITRIELGNFVDDIMSMTDGTDPSMYVLAFPAQQEDRIERLQTERERADDMIRKLMKTPSLGEALPNDATAYYLAHWEKTRRAPSPAAPQLQPSDQRHSPTVLFPTQSLPGVPAAG